MKWWPFKKKVEKEILEDIILTDTLPDGCWRVPGGVQCSFDIPIVWPKEFEEKLQKIEDLRHFGMLMQKRRRIKQCGGCITWKRKGLCAICIQIDEAI